MNVWDKYNWNIWDPQKESLPKHVRQYRKISFCTTCMNRTSDLSETLQVNIEDNLAYPNVEFVLLDYNSKDGTGQWIKDNMMHYIKKGILVYYRTEDPEFYNMPHSRNVAFKLATGEIVNSVDADNFIRPGFADYLNRMAEFQTASAVFAKGKRMMHGRIGFYKDEWLALGGYDEDLVGYGFDDHNMLYRAMLNKCKLMWWGGDYYARIKTSKKEAIKNYHKDHSNWKKTEGINKKITFDKLEKGEIVANQNRKWGQVVVIKNFEEKIIL